MTQCSKIRGENEFWMCESRFAPLQHIASTQDSTFPFDRLCSVSKSHDTFSEPVPETNSHPSWTVTNCQWDQTRLTVTTTFKSLKSSCVRNVRISFQWKKHALLIPHINHKTAWLLGFQCCFTDDIIRVDNKDSHAMPFKAITPDTPV